MQNFLQHKAICAPHPYTLFRQICTFAGCADDQQQHQDKDPDDNHDLAKGKDTARSLHARLERDTGFSGVMQAARKRCGAVAKQVNTMMMDGEANHSVTEHPLPFQA